MAVKRAEFSNAYKLISRLQGYKAAAKAGKLSAAVKKASLFVAIEKDAAVALSGVKDLMPFVTEQLKIAKTFKLTAENLPTAEQLNIMLSSPAAEVIGLFGSVEALSFNAKLQDGTKTVAVPAIFKKGSGFTAGSKVTALVAGRFYEVDSLADLLKFSENVEVLFKLGVHLRSAAMITKEASRPEFKSTKVTMSYKGRTEDAKSIMDLPLLNAPRNSIVTLDAEGPEAEKLVKALIKVMTDPENIKKA